MSDYPYASGELLDQRNTYFYTPYGGVDFLRAWLQQRSEAAASAVAGFVAGQAVAARTDELLETLAQSLAATVVPEAASVLLARLIQRFEVSKRLHAEYGSNWRPADPEAFRDLGRYLRFAEVLELAWRRGLGLPSLNALLKCLDTLSAMRHQLNADEQRRLAAVIGKERAHVATLAQRLGVAGVFDAA